VQVSPPRLEAKGKGNITRLTRFSASHRDSTGSRQQYPMIMLLLERLAAARNFLAKIRPTAFFYLITGGLGKFEAVSWPWAARPTTNAARGCNGRGRASGNWRQYWHLCFLLADSVALLTLQVTSSSYVGAC